MAGACRHALVCQIARQTLRKSRGRPITVRVKNSNPVRHLSPDRQTARHSLDRLPKGSTQFGRAVLPALTLLPTPHTAWRLLSTSTLRWWRYPRRELCRRGVIGCSRSRSHRRRSRRRRRRCRRRLQVLHDGRR